MMNFLTILVDVALGATIIVIGTFVLSLIVDAAVKAYRNDE
jgi:hypothetical protein